MKTGLGRRWAAGAARRFLRQERGAISPIFVLMLIPIAGVMALAVEMGNAAAMQRSLQHAADSAAIAAAINADSKSDGTNPSMLRYVREAISVAAQYPAVGSANVTTLYGNGASTAPVRAENIDCPGAAANSLGCYRVTITRTVSTQLARVVGMTSISPAAVAIASAAVPVNENDCVVSTATTGTGINANGNGSTDFSKCYLRTSAAVKCSTLPVLGIITNSAGDITGGCKHAYTPPPANQTSWPDPFADEMSKLVNGQAYNNGPAPLSSGDSHLNCISNLTTLSGDTSAAWYTYNNVQYAKVCANVSLSANTDIGSTTTNRVLYVTNGATIDLNGNALTATAYSGTDPANHPGTTIVATGASTNTLFDNTSNKDATLQIMAPTNANGTNSGDPFAGFAIVGIATSPRDLDKSKPKNVNMGILGILYAPNFNLILNGSNTSYFSGPFTNSCSSLIDYTLMGNGGKLTATGCGALGYNTSSEAFYQVALVQ